ncbi:MAG TPA: heme-binding protein [Xanthobacteraceae bacterium]|nr:heme-binding protein [Xanthobacteraceae bacterium]
MPKLVAILAAAAAILVGASAYAQPQAPLPPPAPPFGMPITLAQAMKAAEAAVAEAKKNNMLMAIAVVEPSGALVYFLKMDGTQYASIRSAQDKATSAALFRRSTKTFFDRVAAGDLSPMALAGAVASAGGVPIVVDGKFIGAIGSSGGNDDLISQAGANALK